MSASNNGYLPAPRQADDLLAEINEAVSAANEAETMVTTAQAELVSRSKKVGVLLLEAKKLHPVVKDFEAFLQKVQGLKRSRAYDLLRLAGDRTTDDELKREARDRQRKSRAGKRLPKPEPAPKADQPKLSVTSRNDEAAGNDAENADACAERRQAEMADLSLTPEEKAAKLSAHNLSEFQVACRIYLPKMIEADLKKARVFFMEGTWKANRRKAA